MQYDWFFRDALLFHKKSGPKDVQVSGKVASFLQKFGEVTGKCWNGEHFCFGRTCNIACCLQSKRSDYAFREASMDELKIYRSQWCVKKGFLDGIIQLQNQSDLLNMANKNWHVITLFLHPKNLFSSVPVPLNNRKYTWNINLFAFCRRTACVEFKYHMIFYYCSASTIFLPKLRNRTQWKRNNIEVCISVHIRHALTNALGVPHSCSGSNVERTSDENLLTHQALSSVTLFSFSHGGGNPLKFYRSLKTRVFSLRTNPRLPHNFLQGEAYNPALSGRNTCFLCISFPAPFSHNLWKHHCQSGRCPSCITNLLIA